MERIEVEDCVIADAAHLIERRNDVMLEHGGVVTRMSFDSVEEMSLDAFKRFVVPRMGEAESSLTVVKDSAAGSYSFILGDGVTRYKVNSVRECSLADVCEELKRGADAKFDEIYNMPMPLIRDVRRTDVRRVTAAFPSEERIYKRFDKKYKIYIPPTWFAVSLRPDNQLIECGMCVVLEWESKFEDTKLLRWPLSNVWSSGTVCLGDSEVKQYIDVEHASIADLLIVYRERVLGFTANNDLCDWGYDFIHGIDNLYRELVAEGKLENKDPRSTVERALEILSLPNGWEKIKYAPLGRSAKEFTSI